MQTEADWIERIRGGDDGAFECLFRRYCQALIDFAERYVKDRTSAESIVQDVFLAVWAKRAQLDPTRPIKPYLYVAAKNQALKLLRDRAVERRAAAMPVAPPHLKTPEDEWQQKELAATLGAAIAALPERCRLIFAMNRFDRLTYAEIAAIEGISIKTVETQMGRALKALRRRLLHLR